MSDAFPNQLTGDPDELEWDGQLYQQTSDAISDAISQIAELGSNHFSSHAVTALDRNQGDVVEKMSRIQYRYHEAGGALVTYAKALRQAQAEAASAIAAHGPLSDQATDLQYRIEDETRLAQQQGPDQMQHIQQLQQLVGAMRDVQAAQGEAQRAWSGAKAMKDAAAATARIAIHVGDEKNDLDDGLWDTLATFIPILLLVDRIAQMVLKIVSLVLTILAIVFAVLSLIFPILAPVAAALFGYAQLVNLAIAVLALLAFLMDGFNLVDLALVAVAVVATFGSGLLGDFLGAAANAAISSAMADVSGVAGQVLGAVAKNAITEGLKDVTKEAVDDVLFHGSSEAQALDDAIGPSANAFLNTSFADDVTAIKNAGTGLGTEIGTYARAGLDSTPFPGILHMPFSELSSFADHGGLGNLQWAKDGYDAVQSHLIDPLQHAQKAGNALMGNITAFDPDHLFSRFDGPGSANFTAGDVAGDRLGDAVHDTAMDWAGAASRGQWGGAAQWAVGHAGVLLPASGSTTLGAIGDKLGDLYGDMQSSAQGAVVSAHVPPSDWGPTDWSEAYNDKPWG